MSIRHPNANDWSDARIKLLTDLWGRDLPTAAIASLMRISKDSVVGKAHRLRLPSRPSPILRRPPGADGFVKAYVRRLRGPTLPSLQKPAAPATAPATPAVIEPMIEPSPPPAPTFTRRVRECIHTSGQRGSWIYCEEPAAQGSPFCEAHRPGCVVRIRDHQPQIAIDPHQARAFPR